MNSINEVFLKVSGQFPYPDELKMDQDIKLFAGAEEYTFTVVKMEDKSNQDGTVNRIFTLKLNH